MKRNLTSWSLCAVMASAVSYGLPAAADSHSKAPSLQHTTVLSGLESPWDMAFLQDGTMFFTERCRGLSVRLTSGDVNALLGMTGTDGYASTADDLFCEGQAGMMGVEIDPDFADNRFIYVYSTLSRTSRTSRLRPVIRLAAPVPTTGGACASARTGISI